MEMAHGGALLAISLVVAAPDALVVVFA